MPKELFGKLKAAQPPLHDKGGEAIKSHEMDNEPSSKVILNAENKQKIKRFFDIAFENQSLKGFYENIILLYVVSGEGVLSLAIEELFKNDSQDESLKVKTGVAKLVGHGPHFGLPKLGHPSLLPLEDKQARLAGEIYYRDQSWFINDSSGRYTESNSENSKYIDNVVTLFSMYGIRILPAYKIGLDKGEES